MPQMAPYNWLMMFLLFNFLMYFFMSYNNYINIPIFKNINNLNMYMYIWKW